MTCRTNPRPAPDELAADLKGALVAQASAAM